MGSATAQPYNVSFYACYHKLYLHTFVVSTMGSQPHSLIMYHFVLVTTSFTYILLWCPLWVLQPHSLIMYHFMLVTTSFTYILLCCPLWVLQPHSLIMYHFMLVTTSFTYMKHIGTLSCSCLSCLGIFHAALLIYTLYIYYLYIYIYACV